MRPGRTPRLRPPPPLGSRNSPGILQVPARGPKDTIRFASCGSFVDCGPYVARVETHFKISDEVAKGLPRGRSPCASHTESTGGGHLRLSEKTVSPGTAGHNATPLPHVDDTHGTVAQSMPSLHMLV